MRGQKELYELLEKLAIQFEYYEHPPLFTIDEAKIHWKDYNSGRCKNIFFRKKKLSQSGNHIVIEWFYEEGDLDLKEAGYDIALLAEMDFTFIPKKSIV